MLAISWPHLYEPSLNAHKSSQKNPFELSFSSSSDPRCAAGIAARLLARSGYHQGREVLSSAGAIELIAPRVKNKLTDPATGEQMRFCSAILPLWARKTPKITEVLPLLYLHGLSSGRLRARSRPVPGLIRWAVGDGDHRADRGLAGRAARPRGPGHVAGELRLPACRGDPT
jgi:hypothetical protein